ncbi:acyl-CoA transferase, partial [Methylobacterium sp. WL116]
MSAETFAATIRAALGSAPGTGALTITGTGTLPSAFPVTDLAAGSVAAAGLAIADLVGTVGA